MHYYLFDDPQAENFLPMSATHPVFDLRSGPFTFLERLIKIIDCPEVNLFVHPELQGLVAEQHPGVAVNPPTVNSGVWLQGNVLWTKALLDLIAAGQNVLYYSNEKLVAAKLSEKSGMEWLTTGGPLKSVPGNVKKAALDIAVPSYLWDLITMVGETLETDKHWFSNWAKMDTSSNPGYSGPEQIYLSPSAQLKPGINLDASTGPIIIDDGAEINSGTVISGPVYIGKGCVITANSVIRPGTVAGPDCRLGGEISRSIILGKSNKSHFGFLGDSFLGEWVNLGAGTTTSNLKNNYRNIAINIGGKKIDASRLNLGALIGDHCKTAILSRLNTGTYLGTACILAGDGLLPVIFEPFSFYFRNKVRQYDFEKFLATTRAVMCRRGEQLSAEMLSLLKQIHSRNKISRIG